MHLQLFRILVVGCLPLSMPAQAEVVESNASAMQIRHVVTLAAPADNVYLNFLKVSAWWDKEHTYSGDAANLKLTATPGGCFCETLANGGGVVHLTVVNVAPNERLIMKGALGPLQTTGVAGVMSISFAPKSSGSELVMVYNVGGYYPGGLQKVAPLVDDVLFHQLQRLKRLVETGSAESAEDKPAAPQGAGS